MLISREKIDAVIRRIYEGEASSLAIKSEGLDLRNFYRALEHDFESEQNFARAQLVAATTRAEEIVTIVDTETCPQRARNRMDARRWLASKMDPKKYGDRIDLNIESRVDIRSTIEEARSRSPLLPGRDLPITVEAQVIDIIKENIISSSGPEPEEPEEPAKSDITKAIDLDDLLS